MVAEQWLLVQEEEACTRMSPLSNRRQSTVPVACDHAPTTTIARGGGRSSYTQDRVNAAELDERQGPGVSTMHGDPQQCVCWASLLVVVATYYRCWQEVPSPCWLRPLRSSMGCDCCYRTFLIASCRHSRIDARDAHVSSSGHHVTSLSSNQCLRQTQRAVPQDYIQISPQTSAERMSCRTTLMILFNSRPAEHNGIRNHDCLFRKTVDFISFSIINIDHKRILMQLVCWRRGLVGGTTMITAMHISSPAVCCCTQRCRFRRECCSFRRCAGSVRYYASKKKYRMSWAMAGHREGVAS